MQELIADQFTHYYVFCATVVLYVSVIQGQFEPWGAGEDFLEDHLKDGEQAQKDLNTYGASSSYCRRYVLVLEELRNEARRSIRYSRQNPESRMAVTPHPHPVASLSTAAATGNQSSIYVASRTPQRPIEHQDLASNNPSGGLVSTLGLSEIESQSETRGQTDSAIYAASLPTTMDDFTNWGEFDSLALTGLGDNLDLVPPVESDEQNVLF
jgi:hypothetical protein